ncbi:MAG TPA: GGDEF domain-containing protein [Candidatus Paceibacterota bacterium]
MSEGLSGTPRPPWRDKLEITRQKIKYAQQGAELKDAQDKAAKDELTGLMSRRAFMERADSILKDLYAARDPQKSQRDRKISSVCFIGVDIDHFRIVNKKLGHPGADVVLKQIAETLTKGLRASDDLVARIGGEEITILFLGSRELALTKAKELCAAIEALPFDVDGKPVTASFGVTEVGADEEPSLDEMLKRADKALYAAKDAGRNRVVEYSLALEAGS